MCKEDNLKNLTCVNSSCSSARLTGQNSLNFLNNLLISDLSSLSEKIFHFSALCNPKGRIVSTLWVRINGKESIDLIFPKNMPSLLSYFKMRTFRQKIEIQLIDSNIVVDNKANSIDLSSSFKCEQDYSNIDDFYVYLFNQGLPWVDFNNTEKFIPQHVNLDRHENVMNFKKGCYPGQEIIARMKYLGKIKKRMKLLTFKNEKEASDFAQKSKPVSPIIFNKKLAKYQLQIIESLQQSD